MFKLSGFLILYELGTGGTIAGIGQFLKSMNEEVQVVLADPEGSGLYNKVKACLYWLPDFLSHTFRSSMA
jgi:cysteine synthase